ncbi:MAG: tetratricopeptide repeat protein [Spirulinaceae cyanobacterium RM2_2_10]|nr:tetratricopeptide repeat protein [Spirulinaceae cyanobacterium RM2_2_10]
MARSGHNRRIRLDMELFDLITWLGTIFTIVGLGLGAMLWAYRGAGSVDVLFDQPVAADIARDAQSVWQLGLAAFAGGDFRQAKEQFSRVVRSHPDCGAAYHNLGLVHANLRQDDDAVACLLQAGDRYAAADDGAALGLVKQHLSALRVRKEAMVAAREHA